jgi:hypothetical protein
MITNEEENPKAQESDTATINTYGDVLQSSRGAIRIWPGCRSRRFFKFVKYTP